jgi:hypothetical protein
MAIQMKTTIQMKISVVTLLLAMGASFCGSAYAQEVNFGRPINIFADPSDIVVELDINPPAKSHCGSRYFHIQRTSANFKELTAVALTAFSAGKTMTYFVASCNVDRNIVSHGFATSP